MEKFAGVGEFCPSEIFIFKDRKCEKTYSLSAFKKTKALTIY
jgi:hypothetical protein